VNTTQTNRQSDALRIKAVREAWIEAVKSGDIDRLTTMVTDDIVVVHRNGHCINGRDAVRAELLTDFRLFDFEQEDSLAEIVVHDKWALEFSEVESTATAIRGGARVKAHFGIIAVFQRQPDSSWKVARIIGLED
jgi:ketosteroid isomerase-like protein